MTRINKDYDTDNNFDIESELIVAATIECLSPPHWTFRKNPDRYEPDLEIRYLDCLVGMLEVEEVRAWGCTWVPNYWNDRGYSFLDRKINDHKAAYYPPERTFYIRVNKHYTYGIITTIETIRRDGVPSPTNYAHNNLEPRKDKYWCLPLEHPEVIRGLYNCTDYIIRKIGG